MARIYYWRGAVGEASFLEAHHDAIQGLVNGRYALADLEMLKGHRDVFSYRINRVGRLLFTTIVREGLRYLLLLEYLASHDYQKSRFLRSGVLKRYLLAEDAGLSAALLDFAPVDVRPDVLQGLSRADEQAIAMDYYHDAFIQLSAVQEEALQLRLPAVISGAAGSGKSCVAIALLSDAVSRAAVVERAGRFLYVSESPRLVRSLERSWRELPIAQDLPQGFRVDFLSYTECLLDLGVLDDRVAVGRDDFDAWYTAYEKQQRALSKAGRDWSLELDGDTVYQEFRICSSSDYAELGCRQSSLSKDKRSALLKAYDAYVLSLQQRGFVHPAFHSIVDHKESYDLVVVDESQDLSRLQLKNLASMAKHQRIAFCMDSHQSLFDVQSIRPFLLESLWGREQVRVSHIDLPVTYRCPLNVARAANTVIETKYRLTGGLADRREAACILPNIAEGAVVGHVLVLDEVNLVAWAWLREQAQGAHFAVVTIAEHLEAAYGLFPKDRVFTPDDIKGLEYDTVVVFRPFSNKRFSQAFHQLEDSRMPSTAKHRPKAGVGDQTFGPDFNKLFTSITRAKRTLVVCENPSREADYFLRPLQDIMGKAQLVDAEREQTTTLDDWDAEIIRQLDLGHEARAFDVFCAQFKPQGDARKVFAEQYLKPAVPFIAEPIVAVDAASPLLKCDVFKPSESARAPRSEKKKKGRKSMPVALTSEAQNIHALLKDFSKKTLSTFLTTLTFESHWLNTQVIIDGRESTLLHHMLRSEDHTKCFIQCLINELGLLQKIPINELNQYLRKARFDSVQQESKQGLLDLCSIARDFCSDTPTNPLVLIAAYRGRVDALEILIKHGADLDKSNPEGFTPALIAARSGQVAVFAKLAKCGADLNKTMIHGVTPAIFAAQNGQVGVLAILAEYGADLNQATTHGATPAFVAAQYNQVDSLSKLIECGADMNQPCIRGSTPAIVAAEYDHVGIVEKLIECGADLNKSNKHGKTAAFIAAERGHLNIIKCFIKHRVAFNIPVGLNRVSLVGFLASKGIPFNMYTLKSMSERNDGRIESGDQGCGSNDNQDEQVFSLLPIDIANLMGHHEIVSLLRKGAQGPLSMHSMFPAASPILQPLNLQDEAQDLHLGSVVSPSSYL